MTLSNPLAKLYKMVLFVWMLVGLVAVCCYAVVAIIYEQCTGEAMPL